MSARTRRSFEQMRHLQTLSRTLSAAQRPADVARALLRVLRETLPHDRAAVWALDGDEVGEAPIASSGTRKRRALAELRPQALEVMRGGQALLVDAHRARRCWPRRSSASTRPSAPSCSRPTARPASTATTCACSR